MTTAHFADVELGSVWMNQTIRNARARTGVKRFKALPLETNNQNWTLHKVGTTYSLGFGLVRGVKKRIPLEVYGAHAARALDALLEGTAQKGGIKLWRSRQRACPWTRYRPRTPPSRVAAAGPSASASGTLSDAPAVGIEDTPTTTPAEMWAAGSDCPAR